MSIQLIWDTIVIKKLMYVFYILLFNLITVINLFSDNEVASRR